MTSTLRFAAAAAASVLLLSLAACAGGDPEPGGSAPATGNDMAVVATQTPCEGDEGVTVIVDATALGDQDDVSATWCVFGDDTVAAADALLAASIGTEGTDEYGDQVVCRVNGVPAENAAIPAEDGSDYFETCASMPAAFAYWSLWVRPAAGEWGYAQEGLSTLQLEPGDAVELLFTLHGEPAAPTS